MRFFFISFSFIKRLPLDPRDIPPIFFGWPGSNVAETFKHLFWCWHCVVSCRCQYGVRLCGAKTSVLTPGSQALQPRVPADCWPLLVMNTTKQQNISTLKGSLFLEGNNRVTMARGGGGAICFIFWQLKNKIWHGRGLSFKTEGSVYACF